MQSVMNYWQSLINLFIGSIRELWMSMKKKTMMNTKRMVLKRNRMKMKRRLNRQARNNRNFSKWGSSWKKSSGKSWRTKLLVFLVIEVNRKTREGQRMISEWQIFNLHKEVRRVINLNILNNQIDIWFFFSCLPGLWSMLVYRLTYAYN